MPEGTKMSNGTPAHSIGAVDAQWLFPQERAPSSPPRKMRLDKCEALRPLSYFEAKVDPFFCQSGRQTRALCHTRGASSSAGDRAERSHPVFNNDVDVIMDSHWLHATDQRGPRPTGRSFRGFLGRFSVVRR